MAKNFSKKSAELAKIVLEEKRKKLEKEKIETEKLYSAFLEYRSGLDNLCKIFVESQKPRKEIFQILSLAEDISSAEQNLITNRVKTYESRESQELSGNEHIPDSQESAETESDDFEKNKESFVWNEQ